LRPMRPKPLIPTRMVMITISFGCHEALGSWANDHLNELGLVLVTGVSS
jgi:hypothetical protein